LSCVGQVFWGWEWYQSRGVEQGEEEESPHLSEILQTEIIRQARAVFCAVRVAESAVARRASLALVVHRVQRHEGCAVCRGDVGCIARRREGVDVDGGAGPRAE
jgi:hypothetical protein